MASFRKPFLNPYCVPGMILSAGEETMKTKRKNCTSKGKHSVREDEHTTKQGPRVEKVLKWQ